MSDNKEAILTGYPNVISYECTKKIINQMETSICKINIEQKQETGFFCKRLAPQYHPLQRPHVVCR